MLVAIQLFVPGLYLPPVLKMLKLSSIRPRRSFHCRSTPPCAWLVQRARWWCWWLSNYPCRDCISRRCSKRNHHYCRPRRSSHCRSRPPCEASAVGRVGGAGGRPTVGAGIVSAAGVHMACHRSSAPDDHFTRRSRLPCETSRPEGALVMLVAVQLSVVGLYLPPVFKSVPANPPQTIISLPVQTAV